jgi:rare lipoprotein A
VPPEEPSNVNNIEVHWMRKVIFVCAIFTGFTSAASAGERGIASYYQNPHFGGLIAAHRTLPFGTQVKVFNLDNGRSTTVKIVDRGPFIRGRIIDVSPAAANVLGFLHVGLAHVRIE